MKDTLDKLKGLAADAASVAGRGLSSVQDVSGSAAAGVKKLADRVVDTVKAAEADPKDVADKVETVSMGLGITSGVAAAGAALAAPTGLSAVGVALGLTSAPLIVTAAPVLGAAATVAGVVSGGAYFYAKWKNKSVSSEGATSMTSMTSVPCPTTFPAWSALTALAQAGVPHLRDLLADASSRPAPVAVPEVGLTLDYSRQAVTAPVLAQLLALAEQADVAGQREAMFSGDIINTSEQRAVLHVALRGAPNATGEAAPWGAAIQQQVQSELARVLAFAEAVRSGQHVGSSGQAFTDVVNIGIGGSDLGPRMAAEALDAYTTHSTGQGPRVHFVSNPDAWALHSVLRGLDARRTLVIVSSKTFTTQETMTNAASARRWLSDAGLTDAEQSAHLVAITAAPQRSAAMGIPAAQTFTFWDWVGGRYSLWSALGLPLALAVGTSAFTELLAGARAMDAHFRTAPLHANVPILLAVLGIWNRNFLHCPTQLLSTYPSRLVKFAPFVQQMDMESNGKRTRRDGQASVVATGPIIWGGLGIDGQHAYFQLLHQGQHRVPVEFIGVETEDAPTSALPLAAEHHRVVNLNLRAQAQALAVGRNEADTLAALQAEGASAEAAQAFVTQRSFPGNVPNSILWLDALTPSRLGALIALYEHKVFTQAAIWGINAYDQWGVELGKTMAKAMEQGRA